VAARSKLLEEEMSAMNPLVESFHDAASGTFTHVVYDRDGGRAAVIDPVLDFDAASAATQTASADRVLAFVQAHRLTLDWILETHAHADHLSAAAYLRAQSGARIAIGAGITRVQAHFARIFGVEADFHADGRQFDHLFADGEAFEIGALSGHTLATPGHTEDGLTYVIGNAAFVGDTVFAPEAGTARTDFPGGSARELLSSIQAILALPDDTHIHLCHDYPAEGREPRPWFTVAEQRRRNIHVGEAAGGGDFVALRTARDATLATPRLLLPALQINIRAGEFPPPDADGMRYLRLPLNALGKS
jgi:glyoxylase-like metal-dependent hydrolase (beta-lactamase superfamily II)